MANKYKHFSALTVRSPIWR